ncbi:HPP family protein [Planctomycetota bacterium]
MFTAEEIMVKDVVYVTKDTPIREAIEIMLRGEISGLPVVGDDMSLEGVITEKDVVGLIYDLDSLESKKVRNYMTEHAISFEKDDSLVDICDFLTKNLFRRVPITSDGKLVGIISVPDIIRYALVLSSEGGSKPQ